MNQLDHVVTDNIKTNKYQLNEAIYNDPTFDTSVFNSSSGTRDLLPVVTVTLREAKKPRATTVADITCLWDSGVTNRMVKIKHTKYYELKMLSDKVEYSTADGVYCTAHDVKVPFLCRIFPAAR